MGLKTVLKKQTNIIIAIVAALSFAFNIYQYYQQSKQSEKHAEEVKALNLKLVEMQEKSKKLLQFQTNLRGMSTTIQNKMVDLKFLNYRLFKTCANKSSYTEKEFQERLESINDARFTAIKNYAESYIGKDILKRVFGDKIYGEVACSITWNIKLYDYIDKNKTCTLPTTKDIPICKQYGIKYKDFCSLEQLDLVNFDNQLETWHQCQVRNLNDYIESKGVKLGLLLEKIIQR